MSSSKKAPPYNPENISQSLIDSVAEAYQRPGENGTAPSLNTLAKQFGMTVLKIRKLLITAGVYHTELSDRVQLLASQGKCIADIQKELQLGRASVHSYLPYVKTVYKMPEQSPESLRVRRFRQRNQCVDDLRRSMQDCMADHQACTARQLPWLQFWKTVEAYEGYPFFTDQGEKFTYTVIETGLNIHPPNIFIPKALVEYNWCHFLNIEISKSGTDVDTISGAGFLYPFFRHIGIFDH